MQQALSLSLSGGGVMRFIAVVSVPATPSAAGNPLSSSPAEFALEGDAKIVMHGATERRAISPWIHPIARSDTPRRERRSMTFAHHSS